MSKAPLKHPTSDVGCFSGVVGVGLTERESKYTPHHMARSEKWRENGEPPPSGHNHPPKLISGKEVLLSVPFFAVGAGVTYVNGAALQEHLDMLGVTARDFLETVMESIINRL